MRESSPRDVSLVIPGRNCAATLDACLASAQRLLDAGELREVIFVDDDSTDDSNSLARRYPVRILQCGGHGPGAARNVGWRVAHGDLVWFVDADCVIEHDALARLRSCLNELGAGVVGGSYANVHPGSRTARLIHHEMVMRHRRIGKRSSFAITANLLCRRSVLNELDGFDEKLKLAQDLDFAYRVVDAGITLGFNVESHVAHHHETRLARYLYKQGRQGYWRIQLYRKHPGRMRGDSYSGVLDYAQPPLALLSLVSAGAGVACVPFASSLAAFALATSAVSFGTTLLLQLPMAISLSRELGSLDAVCYVGMGTLRALTRGIGMAAGVVGGADHQPKTQAVTVAGEPSRHSS